MKYLLLCALPAFSAFVVNDHAVLNKPVAKSEIVTEKKSNDPSTLNFQGGEGKTRISAIQFKSQKYCRAELKDFEFDAHFTVLGATVYFSGANFKDVQVATITSSSLSPIASLMARCGPGSVVVFDNIKVKGPDNMERIIDGVTYVLY